MTEPSAIVALTGEEVGEVLTHCSESALLVGGQALAFWATHYAVKPAGILATAVTTDVDFIGSAKVAANLGRSLGWQLWMPSSNDPSPQVAKLTKTVPGVGIKQIDFLDAILGLQTTRVEQRAVKVTFPNGARIRVLHPLDVLESRVRNILLLTSERNKTSVAQAALAITITRRFLVSMIEERVDKRIIWDAVERVAKIALNKRLAEASAENKLNPLLAVPVPSAPGDKLQSQRWQEILQDQSKLKKRIRHRAGHQR
jgi:hypothetical protein